MDKVTGVIESREVKDVVGRGGKVNQLIALTVNGAKYSTFDNSVPADVAERLGALKTGDEVELTYKENPGKGRDGSPVTYLNIVDAVRVDRVSPAASPGREAQPGVQSSGHGKAKTTTGEAPDARARSMTLAYVKDLIVAGKVCLEEWKSYAQDFAKYVETGE